MPRLSEGRSKLLSDREYQIRGIVYMVGHDRDDDPFPRQDNESRRITTLVRSSVADRLPRPAPSLFWLNTPSLRALDGVSLQIKSGEFVSVVGRSGSGKTTLLDLVGLLLRPSEGQVLVDGTQTARLGDGQRADLRGRQIGFIFQEYNLLPTLNVLENVMLPLRYVRKSGGHEGKRRALQLLDVVGLADRSRSRPNELSGGQQQRVAIARALMNRPALVLADEPTGAVDTQTAQEVIGVMRRLNREEGVTFALMTHDLDLASQTDRMIRLSDGKVVSDQVRVVQPLTLTGHSRRSGGDMKMTFDSVMAKAEHWVGTALVLLGIALLIRAVGVHI